jgi:cell wall-associated NlpC family hydrolase
MPASPLPEITLPRAAGLHPALHPAFPLDRPARPTTVRISLRRAVAVAGLTAALGVPLAVPASAAPGPARTTAARATSSPTSNPTSSPTLRLGARGPAVVTLQQLLHIDADGVFGRGTRRAVIRFQRAEHLPSRGVVGPRTWRALRARAAAESADRPSRSGNRATLGARAVAEAARHEGKPYVYGANGPDAFDCSGFVQYVYSRVGMTLPRTSGAQAAAARPVAQADRQPGDLVIFRRGGRVNHVGIYAGDDTMWVARHTGTTITRQRLWTTAYTVGRFA